MLATEGFTGGDRLLTMYGGMDPLDREAVKAAFQAAPVVSPVRILLATDACIRHFTVSADHDQVGRVRCLIGSNGLAVAVA